MFLRSMLWFTEVTIDLSEIALHISFNSEINFNSTSDIRCIHSDKICCAVLFAQNPLYKEGLGDL